MGSPSTVINRFDLSMSFSEFSLLANRKNFVGPRVLPAVGVAEQSSSFAKITVESVLGPIETTLRAPKGTYKRDDFEWTTDSYATEDHGVEEVIDDRTQRMYGSEIRAEQIHVQRAINRVLMSYEDAVATAVFNTTTWTGSALTTTIGTKWDVKASADPIADIDAAIGKVETSSGQKPNTLIVTSLAMRSLKRADRIEDLLKYSGRDDPKNVGIISGLKELFDLENIIVANGYKNTADKGQSASFSRLWDTTMAMVCHINPDNDLESASPTIGRTVMWTEENGPIPGASDPEPGVIIEEYREERRRGGVIRARHDRQIKILHAESGHLLTGVL